MTTNDAAVDDVSVDSLMGQITDEFLDRLNRGERPEVEEYARRHIPRLAEVIRQVFFPALEGDPPRPVGGGIAAASARLRGGVSRSLGDFHLLRGDWPWRHGDRLRGPAALARSPRGAEGPADGRGPG